MPSLFANRPTGRDDRQGPAKELHDLLEARGVRVWFSEKDGGIAESTSRT